MAAYLGKTKIDTMVGTPFEGYTKDDWALEYISSYGQTDGAHHKLWVLDQVARILNGTKIEVSLAKWANGTEEYRFNTGEPSEQYLQWVQKQRGELSMEEGYYEYSYDEGIAP